MDWTKEDNKHSANVPEGYHRLEIVNFYHGKKGGGRFESRGGDPQVLLIFEDADGRQATAMHTLSEKAAWTMQKLLSRLGHDMAALNERSLDIADFTDANVCRELLIDRSCWAHVTHDQSGHKTYTNVEPMHADEVPADVLQRAKQRREPDRRTVTAGDVIDDTPHFDDDDIPF
ncbi:MAG: hypothetical protein AAF916_06990 [Planctomycetota bacterium]